MRFIHTADLHLGKSLHELPLLEDQRYILEQILQLAREHQAQAILISGDVYDKALPPAEAVSLLDSFLTQTAAANISCLVISGNHDSPSRLAFGSRLISGSGVHISRPYGGGVERVLMADEYGEVAFYLLPFIKPLSVRAACVDAADIASYTDAVRFALRDAAADACPRKVLLAHQFVTAHGCETEFSESETISLGGADNVDAAELAAFAYVALGHLHAAQSVGHPNICYSGSPLKYSFSEAKHTKSVNLITINTPGQVEVERLPLTPRRELRELSGSLAQLIEAGYTDPAADDYLRISLTDVVAVDAHKRLQAVYPNLLRLDYLSSAPTMRPQAKLLSERLNPLELFSRFYQERSGSELSDEQRELAQSVLARLGGEE